MTTYEFCETCDRPMRPKSTKVGDHPGTVARQREGLCQSCNRGAEPRGEGDPLASALRSLATTLPGDKRGLCEQTDPEVFYDPDGQGQVAEKARRIKAAKRICQQCPARRACLEVAIANREQHGIWGGLTPEERGVRTRAQRTAEWRERVAS